MVTGTESIANILTQERFLGLLFRLLQLVRIHAPGNRLVVESVDEFKRALETLAGGDD